MYCTKCGVLNPDEAKFCKNCGHNFEEDKQKEAKTDFSKNQAKKVTVENTNYRQTTPKKSRDSSDWISCCVCLIFIFIVFAIFGLL